jgi:hypothetical protein
MEERKQGDDDRHPLTANDVLPVAGNLAKRLPLELVLGYLKAGRSRGPVGFPEPLKSAEFAHWKHPW